MFGMRHPEKRDEKRQRASAIAVESLEDRVVLSAAVAEVEIQYLRAINHLNGILQGHVNQVTSTLTRQVSRLDAQYEATLSRTALADEQRQRRGSPEGPGRSVASVGPGQRQGRPGRRQGGSARQRVHRRLRPQARRRHRPVRQAQRHDPERQPLLPVHVPGRAERGQWHGRGRGPGAQAAVQGTTSLVDAAIAQAGTAGTPAVSVADVASSQLAVVSQAQVAAVQASLAQFRNQFYSTFTPMRAEMAALASAQLPPISLGGAGHGTGLRHGHGSSNTGNNGRHRHRDGHLHRASWRRGDHGHRQRGRERRRRDREHRRRLRLRHARRSTGPAPTPPVSARRSPPATAAIAIMASARPPGRPAPPRPAAPRSDRPTIGTGLDVRDSRAPWRDPKERPAVLRVVLLITYSSARIVISGKSSDCIAVGIACAIDVNP